MSIRGQRSIMSGGWSLFLAHRGGGALTCFVFCLLLIVLSSAGSFIGTIATISCLLAAAYAFWAMRSAFRALLVRRNGRPGTARIEAIQEAFALNHPKDWPNEIRDRSKAQLVFIDNFGKRHRSLVHPRRYFGTLAEGSMIGVYVGKRRSWWNGDVGRREAEATPLGQPAGLTE